MNIAITGGTGFIGSKLVIHHLERGDAVRVLSRRSPAESGLPDSVRWCYGDLTGGGDAPRFFTDKVDILYRCAGEIRDVTRMESLHAEGTRKLIGAAAGKVGLWVQLSSVGVYGQPRYGRVTEQSPLNPLGIYEATKKHSDDLVCAAGVSGAFAWSILRLPIVFGEGMPNQSLFQMIRVIDRGHFFFIGKPGASENYIYVDNVVQTLTLRALLPEAKGNILTCRIMRHWKSLWRC